SSFMRHDFRGACVGAASLPARFELAITANAVSVICCYDDTAMPKAWKRQGAQGWRHEGALQQGERHEPARRIQARRARAACCTAATLFGFRAVGLSGPAAADRRRFG